MADALSSIVGDLAAPYALISSASRYIGTLIPDVTVREVHSDEFTITSHPTENGAPISDHYFANPKVIEIVCAWSDSTGGYPGYVQDAYQAMLALANTREAFDVSTGKRQYSNMLFGNFTVVTDDSSEYALMVTARLQEIIISNTSGGGATGDMTAANQASPADTAPQADAGVQGLQPVGTAASLPSFAQGTSTPSLGPVSGAGGLSTGATPIFASGLAPTLH